MKSKVLLVGLVPLAWLWVTDLAFASQRFPYVQDFTGYTLKSRQVKLGLSPELGISNSFSLGTDLVAAMAGAANAKVKLQFWRDSKQSLSLGISASYLDKQSILWGSVDRLFDQLEARLIRPQISWSRRISQRLTIHSSWSFGLGDVKAKLSERGRRKLWESKFPRGDYDTMTKDDQNQDPNLEGNQQVSHRALHFQSLLGLSRDFFQVTGEFGRETRERVLLTSRVDAVRIEGLKSQGLRFTAAQEWNLDNFNFRLGLGVLYQVLSGVDLDDERVDSANFIPVGEFDFYWLL